MEKDNSEYLEDDYRGLRDIYAVKRLRELERQIRETIKANDHLIRETEGGIKANDHLIAGMLSIARATKDEAEARQKMQHLYKKHGKDFELEQKKADLFLQRSVQNYLARLTPPTTNNN